MKPFGRLAREESGFVLVFVAVAIPALLGLVGLALDGTRLMTLDTRLAAEADAAALAAANRLDRTDAAMANARRAAADLAGEDGSRLVFRFAATLADLRASATASLPESAAADAVYVEVATGEGTLDASLLGLLGVRPTPIRRRAIAESLAVACDVTPLALCHADPDRFAAGARPGRQYLLRMDGTIGDGALVALDRPDDLNTRTTLRSLASNAPAFCYGDGVAPRRNIAAQDFDEAINVRFDRYFNNGGPIATDLAAFPPAPNIIQGRHLNTCASPPGGGDVDPPFHLPRDAAYRRVRPNAGYDEGVGDWKLTAAYGGIGAATIARALDEYVLWNHADKDRSFQDAVRGAATRYEIYLRELGLTEATDATPVRTAGNALAGRTMPTGGPRTGPSAFVRESPIPICYPGTQPATQARRRILYLTVADCRGLGENARAVTLSRHVAKIFLTEPASGGALLAEFVAFLRPMRDDGKLRRIVQLVEAR